MAPRLAQALTRASGSGASSSSSFKSTCSRCLSSSAAQSVEAAALVAPESPAPEAAAPVKLRWLTRGKAGGVGNLGKDHGAMDDTEFKKWAKGEGAQWMWPLQGKSNWFAPGLPFPQNTTFRPIAPLSAGHQREIYNAFTTFPIIQTPTSSKPINLAETISGWSEIAEETRNSDNFKFTQIGEVFGLSKERVIGCVKLIQLEEMLTRHQRPHQIHAKRGMESALGCSPRSLPAKTYRSSESWATSEPGLVDIQTAQQLEGLESGILDEVTADLHDTPAQTPSRWREGWQFLMEGMAPVLAIGEAKRELGLPTEAAPVVKLPVAPSTVVPSNKNYVWNFVDTSGTTKFSNQGHDRFKKTPIASLQNEEEGPDARKRRRQLEARMGGTLDLYRNQFARLPVENPDATLEDAPDRSVPNKGLYRRLVRQHVVKPSMSPDGVTETIQPDQLVVQEPRWKEMFDRGFLWDKQMGKRLRKADIIQNTKDVRRGWKARNANPLLERSGPSGTQELPLGRYLSRSEQSALTRKDSKWSPPSTPAPSGERR